MSNNNFDEIVNNLKKQKDNKDAQDYLMGKLNESQSKKLKEVMSDKSALEKMLSTPQAKEILKKFSEEKK